jgi:uncharacterized protein
MDINLKNILIEIAENNIKTEDPSHDICHAIRVLKNAEYISSKEGGDLDVIVPAALFHDIICYPKNSPNSKHSTKASADFATVILKELPQFPQSKISKVNIAIEQCSFSKGIVPELLEAKILQDADRLEATGVISIMRTFCSAGLMKSKLYNDDDPFCKNREPDSLEYALDLFYSRLLKVKDTMHTGTARNIGERRTRVLQEFLENLELELLGI